MAVDIVSNMYLYNNSTINPVFQHNLHGDIRCPTCIFTIIVHAVRTASFAAVLAVSTAVSSMTTVSTPFLHMFTLKKILLVF